MYSPEPVGSVLLTVFCNINPFGAFMLKCLRKISPFVGYINFVYIIFNATVLRPKMFLTISHTNNVASKIKELVCRKNVIFKNIYCHRNPGKREIPGSFIPLSAGDLLECTVFKYIVEHSLEENRNMCDEPLNTAFSEYYFCVSLFS